MKKIIEENKYKLQAIVKRFVGFNNEDLMQEIYIKAWKNLPKYTENNKFSSWISAIASNVCKDYLKSKAYKQEKLNIGNEEIIENIKDKDDIQEKLDSRTRQKIILNAINSLPKKMKDVIVLFELEEKSLEYISKKLQIPEGTVKSRLHSARKILSEKLQNLL